MDAPLDKRVWVKVGDDWTDQNHARNEHSFRMENSYYWESRLFSVEMLSQYSPPP